MHPRILWLPVSNRRSREAPSSPSSTCPSTLAVCCPPSSPPCSEVSMAANPWNMGLTQMWNLKPTCVNVFVWFPAQECGIHAKMKCYPLAFGVPAALMVVALSKNFPFLSELLVVTCRSVLFVMRKDSLHIPCRHRRQMETTLIV